MSRTDAHRPYFVWVADETRWREERHDHRDGHCGLPPEPRELGSWGDCRWSLRPGYPRMCACALCAQQPWRDRQRGSARTRERVLLRAAVRGADEEELEAHEAAVRSANPRG